MVVKGMGSMLKPALRCSLMIKVKRTTLVIQAPMLNKCLRCFVLPLHALQAGAAAHSRFVVQKKSTLPSSNSTHPSFTGLKSQTLNNTALAQGGPG